ncbi:MAG: porin family protein [Bacteroidia bacterium]|nr:porin family protein [Bacteroidia bacterium]
MKKIVLAVFLSIFSISVFAQEPISFGLKVGWNTDRLTSDYTKFINDFKNGFQGGVFFSFNIKRFYIQPEAYFSIKRGILQATIYPGDPQKELQVKQTVNLQSIDVPLLVGFKLLDKKLIRFRIWGGPVVSFAVNKEYTLSNVDNGNDLSDRITSDDFKTAIWSGQIGAGLDLFMLTFDFGYEFGLDSFLTVKSLDNFNLRNNLFYCSIGWRLF